MKNLQKCFLALFVVSFIFSTSLYAKTSSVFTQLSFGTSAVMYGDDDVKAQTQAVKDLDGAFRFILSTDLTLGFKLSQEVSLVAGGLLTSDICTNSTYYVNRFDYGMFSGARIYTGLAGLIVGVDYVCGTCTSFYNLEGDGPSSDSTQWANGYRFLLEYDFSNGTTRLAPILCLRWRRMPRGEYYDNNFTVSFKLSV